MRHIATTLLCLIGTSIAQTPYSQKMLRTSHVVVYFDTTGSNAPGLMTDSDKNGTPDYIDSIAIHAEGYWTEVVAGMGVTAPAYDANRYPAYPIFVADIPATATMRQYGYNEVVTYPASRVVIENDFRYNNGTDSSISQQPDGNGGYVMVGLPSHPFTLLKGIVYHELTHAVQRNYVTNPEFGSIWGEKVTTWMENRTLGARGIASHEMEFTTSLDEDFLRSTSHSARYGQSRFLEVLAREAGPTAVLDVFKTRKRWVDSLGTTVVDNPAFETAFFQSILQRHGLSWDRFLLAYSEQLARLFLVRGSLFPADEQFFIAGNYPDSHLMMSLPWADTTCPLRLSIYTLPMIQLGAGTNVSLRCPTGACYATFYSRLNDSLWSVMVDAAHPASLVIPSLYTIKAYILSGLDSTRKEFAMAATGVAVKAKGAMVQATWSPGQVRVQGLEPNQRARLRAWNLRGSLVLDVDVIGGEHQNFPRPMAEGLLATRIELQR